MNVLTKRHKVNCFISANRAQNRHIWEMRQRLHDIVQTRFSLKFPLKMGTLIIFFRDYSKNSFAKKDTENHF